MGHARRGNRGARGVGAITSGVACLAATLLCACPPADPARRGEARSAPAAAPDDPRIDALLAAMTLDEAIGQMAQYHGAGADVLERVRRGEAGSLLNVTGARATNDAQRVALTASRLRIPLLFGFDVLHGYETIFPIPLAQASSWDPALVEASARVAGEEAAAAGVRWVFAPMVDIARDPRWGRIAEGAGEDPFLGAAMAAAQVRGFQGRDPRSPRPVMACVKHFVGYGAALAGRDYAETDLSERALREVYLPPFRAALAAGAGSVMSAFSTLNGVPSTANAFTLTEILRREWGWDGVVVSDWRSIPELVTHGFAATASDAALAAVRAGVDVDMQGGAYAAALAGHVREGRLARAVVDEAARRVLRSKLRLGLFDRPYVEPAVPDARLVATRAEAAREMARRSMVLLRNEGGSLPIRRDLGAIAVVGPLADDAEDPIGPWGGAGGRATTVLAALERRLPGKVLHARGCAIEGGDRRGFADAVRVAREASVVVAVLGEAASMSGEAASRAHLELPGEQLALLEALHATGKPIVVVLMNGRPLVLSRVAELAPSILETWFLGAEAGTAIAEALLGDVSPGGKLPVTFPRDVGQVPIFYAERSGGRPASDERFSSKYLDSEVTPLYPFGHGLGYTRFEYTDLRVSAARIAADGHVTVSVTLRNAGEREGDEVVQLYVQDVVASVARPARQLAGFERVRLAKGEARRVELTLGPEQLGFWGASASASAHAGETSRSGFVVEPGEFRVWVGGSSVGGLAGSFAVEPAR